MGAPTFGLFLWAAGLTAGTETVRFAVVGDTAFDALVSLLIPLWERLASDPSGRLTPLVIAGILFLAYRCLAGVLLQSTHRLPCWEAARLFPVALLPGRQYNEGK